MCQYTVPSSISEKDLVKLALKVAGRISYNVKLLWIPYQTLECTILTFEGRTKKTKTALNVMFPDHTLSDKDLILMFRPNFLRYSKVKYTDLNLTPLLSNLPQKKAPINTTDLKSLSNRIVKYASMIQKNLTNLTPMIKHQSQSDIISRLFLPSIKDLTRLTSQEVRKVEDFMEREYVKFAAMKQVIQIALNITGLPQRISFKKKDSFYHPYLIIGANKEYFFVDLVKRGKIIKNFTEDPILTRILKENPIAKEEILHILE
nr:hypothetical protein [Candidatus Baldrarchaeota archaeon]